MIYSGIVKDHFMYDILFRDNWWIEIMAFWAMI